MYKIYFKRPLDIIIAGSALIVLSPILLIICLFVLKYHGQPILFSQKRPGKDEKIFSMYKFRTMNNNTDEQGNLFPDDERLTKFGRTLRATSLDELPELINIVKGDMSLVGPRPLLKEYLPYYNEDEKIRHSVRPGLTGLAQINGRNLSSWDDRLNNDVKYVKNISFLSDVKIILSTIRKVFLKEDIVVGKDHIMKKLYEERSM